MTSHNDIQILRSKLIAMTRLTQRTVDYSIKAFQLGRPELCRAIQNCREEMCTIRNWIADHGRAILATRTPVHPDARFVCAALRISTALEVAHAAAYNIARHSALRFAEGWTPVSAEVHDGGTFVNSLLCLCILSLVNRDVRHATKVLQNGDAGQSFDLAVYLAHHELAQRASTHARFELALIRYLDGIVGQVREIADALLQWHEEIEQRDFRADGTRGQNARVPDLGTVLARGPAMPCDPLRLPGMIPARQGPRLNPSVDSCSPSRMNAEAGSTEDLTPARLMGLQQRVCELLVKNQQLRMALMAERAEIHHDQPC